MKNKIIVLNYEKLLSDIGTLLEEGRRKSFIHVNNIIINTYWSIGKKIVEFEQKGKVKADYGSRLLKNIGEDLSRRAGRGFSWRNLFYMRRFYIIYPKLQTVSAKLTWSHYSLLLGIDEALKRGFYEVEAIKNNYSVRELKRQIDSALFERLAVDLNIHERTLYRIWKFYRVYSILTTVLSELSWSHYIDYTRINKPAIGGLADA